jgi:hypothetical protein
VDPFSAVGGAAPEAYGWPNALISRAVIAYGMPGAVSNGLTKEVAVIRQIRLHHALVVVGVAVLAIVGAAYAVAPGSPEAGPSEVVAYATVLEDGTLSERHSSNNLPQSAVTHPAAGVYCFTDLGFLARSAVVSGNNANANNDTIASVAIDVPPLEGLAGCDLEGANVRVRTLDANGVAGNNAGPYAPALVDHRFVIWLRGNRGD